MTTPAVVRPEWPERAVKLAKLHITAPGAHIAGSYQTLLQESTGWDITLRPDLGGVVATKTAGGERYWIPFAALRNGTLAEAK